MSAAALSESLFPWGAAIFLTQAAGQQTGGYPEEKKRRGSAVYHSLSTVFSTVLADPICIRYRDERNKIQSDSGKQRVRGIRELHQDFIFLIHVPQIIYTGIEQYGNIRRAHHSVSGVWEPVSGASAGPAAGTAEGDFPDDLLCVLFRFRNRSGGGVRLADEGKRRIF